MKIGIVAANNIRYSPYIFFYVNLFKRIGVEYELLFPNRNGIEDVYDGRCHILKWNRKLKTAINYAIYAGEVIKTIQKEKYDALVILTAVNAVYLAPWLIRNFKGRYLVDIRDFSHENSRMYYWLESLALKNSALNVISSGKFRDFLPKADYHICHNLEHVNRESTYCFTPKEGYPIVIGYVGSLSYVEQCRKMMDFVSRDERFSLQFYGSSGSEALLRDYAAQTGCERICFHGAYIASEKDCIIDGVDILFNAYGCGTKLLDCALSNKLYDALSHKKPIITSPSTYMTEMAGCLAYPLDMDNVQNLDDLFWWYRSLDRSAVNLYAENLLNSLIEETERTKSKVIQTIDEMKRVGVS